MAEELASFPSETAARPEMAHVLFSDVVGYSRLPSDEQPEVLWRLRQAVRHSAEYNDAHDNHSLISVPTGDGMALVFLDSDVCKPLRAAVEISTALQGTDGVPLRMGIHTGLVYRVPDINGAEGVSGAGINFAQRVMDCGDAGHILMSQVHASFLCEFEAIRAYLHDLGEAEVKHGVKLRLFNYYDGKVGQAAPPSKLISGGKAAVRVAKSAEAPSCAGLKVVLIYKRNIELDAVLLASLEAELTKRGCEVFVDRHLQVGLNWAREIEQAIRNAEAIIPLLSPAAVGSEMLAFELEIANAAAQQQGGRPRVLPVRVNWEGPLPPNLTTMLDPIHYTLWRGPQDTDAVVAELAAALAKPTADAVRVSRALESPGGAMPLNSPYYIERPSDAELHAAIKRRDSIVLIDTDFQKLNADDLKSVESFFIALGAALANQLNLEKFPEDVWRPKSGPNQNFESYFRREVLPNVRGGLIWALDEVDRLFTCPFGSEVFGLFRSWHNARSLDPEGPWHELSMVICYATEAHLFITDLNQSPFNVGTRVRLRDFSRMEVSRLNELYGQPLPAENLDAFMSLLGGQPYLVRRALHELLERGSSFEELLGIAATDEGPFADHLKRFLVLLSRNESALAFLRSLLAKTPVEDAKVFYRLQAAGLLKGETPSNATFRCDLYARYLRNHLQ